MKEKEIIQQFLSLLSKYWDDPKAHQGFRLLRKQVSSQSRWQEIIDARLMALDGKIEDSVTLLKGILAGEPGNVYALLLLGSILCYDNNQPAEAISIYESILGNITSGQPHLDWLLALTLTRRGMRLWKQANYTRPFRLMMPWSSVLMVLMNFPFRRS